MSRGGDSSQWTAEQTLSYINGMIVADENDEENTLFTALSIAYEYLTNATKRKITWSLSLEKLAYEFIELAFETNMHSAIKDIFKSYRAITQGQYSESLKCVLEHYRDQKLETILETEINSADIALIRALPNIETEDPSPEIIIESLNPQRKRREMQIKNKLRIVWEGYKSIVETVRVNQKLEDIYMTTLNRIFDFVDRYNRVQEFKSFCKSLRTGLQNAFNKRDKAQQQKAIYIDIEKTDVNTRNIEIRMEQFKVTTKLGLWGESFLVLQDINTLMKVRKASLKNSLRCQYYENLALLFNRNSFWHYHAFAVYNYYLAYLTKPKITTEQKLSLSNRLLLSILVIPAVTLESQQTKQIQEKLAGMMISSTKVPSRSEMVELMVSKGVLENASDNIRELWNFMFLQFGVGSLKKGLELVSSLREEEHSNFKELIEASLINKQLISIAEIYQRIKIQSLERLIPLPLPQIKKMLILAHKQQTIDFTFDESQGIIVFEDQNKEINPTEEFQTLFMDVAIAYELERTVDEKHIRRKVQDYIKTAENDIWSIRQYKIDQFKKKMKQPIMDLWKQNLKKQKEEQEKREQEEVERKARQAEAIRANEQAQKILATKKIIINDIISIKEQRVVRIMEKKIEHLTDEEIENLTIEVLNQHLENTKHKINSNKEAKLKKTFANVDYLERERRNRMTEKVQASILTEEEEQKLHQQYTETAKNNFHDHNEHRARLQNLAKFYKGRIQAELQAVNTQFEKDTEDYNKRLTDIFKAKVIARAKTLLEENEKKKEENFQRQALELRNYVDPNEKWGFKKKEPVIAPSAPVIRKQKQPTQPAPSISFKKSTNPFAQLEGVNTKEQAPKKEGKWGIGTKLTAEQKKVQTEPIQQKREVPEKSEKPKDQKWTIGKKIEKAEQKIEVIAPPAPVNKNVFQPPPPENTTEKKGGRWGGMMAPEKKKEEKPAPEVKKGKGKGW